jgi:TonB family protein
MRTLLFSLMALGLTLTGCATSEIQRIARQHDEHVYALWTNPQGVQYVTRECPTVAPPVIDANGVAGPWTPTGIVCADVPGTRDPHDVEFWKFGLHHVVQARIGPYGIPLIPVSPKYKSGQATKIGVVGSRDACEAVRIPMDRKPQGMAGDDTTHMTDPCEGPYYFRRVPAGSASAERTSIWRQPGAETPPRPLGAGDPIPMDTPDPKYRTYFDKVRERIKAKWVYPRQAGERNIEGELVIEFHIAKDGRLEYIELRHRSGTQILDDAGLTAVKMAQPFPPVPEELPSDGLLVISGQFRYQILSGGLVNQLMR